MALISWHDAIDQLDPFIFRISTPDGSGTGWLVSRGNATSLCVIATAAHVVAHAHYWEEPIRLTHHSSGETSLLRAGDRAINIDLNSDTAAITFDRGALILPGTPLPLMQLDHHLKAGIEIGWLGFRAIQGANLCFFSGRTSAYLEDTRSYLVDGVAINGVSGGPAFRQILDKPELIGVVSAYIPNMATGTVLPGVAVVRDVNRFHDLANRLRTLDEAQAQQSAPEESPPPPTPEAPTRA